MGNHCLGGGRVAIRTNPRDRFTREKSIKRKAAGRRGDNRRLAVSSLMELLISRAEDHYIRSFDSIQVRGKGVTQRDTKMDYFCHMKSKIFESKVKTMKKIKKGRSTRRNNSMVGRDVGVIGPFMD